MRLVNGPDDSQGRVEVCISNVWGTISDDGWGNVDGRVVCGMLGYSNQSKQCAIISSVHPYCGLISSCSGTLGSILWRGYWTTSNGQCSMYWQ